MNKLLTTGFIAALSSVLLAQTSQATAITFQGITFDKPPGAVTIDKGSSATLSASVTNTTDAPVQVIIRAVDALHDAHNKFTCVSDFESAKTAGGWLTVESARFALAARKSVSVPMVINVPKNAAPGEHNACVTLRTISEPTVIVPPAESSVPISTRLALRVAVIVPGTINHNVSIVNLESTQSQNEVTITAMLKNNGNVSELVYTRFIVRSTFMGRTKVVQATPKLLLPGATSQVSATQTRPFWGGYYKVSTDATYEKTKASVIRYVLIPPKWQAVCVVLLVITVIIRSTNSLRGHRKGYQAIR